VIDGISMSTAIARTSAPDRQAGIDAVINRLERGEKPGDIAKSTGGKAS